MALEKMAVRLQLVFCNFFFTFPRFSFGRLVPLEPLQRHLWPWGAEEDEEMPIKEDGIDHTEEFLPAVRGNGRGGMWYPRIVSRYRAGFTCQPLSQLQA